METTQGNACVAVSSSNQQKCYASLFIFLCFFFYKIEEQESRTGSAWHKGTIGTGGMGEVAEKGVGG
jgi:hypothetical protein